MERFHSSYITYTTISHFSNMNLLQHAYIYAVNFTLLFLVSENMSGFSHNSATRLRINVLKNWINKFEHPVDKKKQVASSVRNRFLFSETKVKCSYCVPHDVLTLRSTALVAKRFFEIFLPRDSTLLELLRGRLRKVSRAFFLRSRQ